MWIWFILFWMVTPDLYAANPYQLGEVDYFHDKGKGLEEDKGTFDWREASIFTDGKASYYVPPGPVLTLLENPTAENARIYVNWQKQKIEKIIKAQKAINEVSQEEIKP